MNLGSVLWLLAATVAAVYCTCPGVCQPTSYYCPTSYTSGLCPGGNDIQCCKESTQCTNGQCQWTGLYCSGSYVSGLCPGGNDIKCCESSSSNPTGVYGLDVSSLVTRSDFSCLIGQGYQYAIVRAYRSVGSTDPNAIDTIENARAAGLKRVDIYMFPCYSCGDPSGQVSTTVKYLQENGANYTMYWLDIEGKDYWSSDKPSNQRFFQSMVSEALRLRQTIGVYTSKNEWSTIMGDSYTGGSAYPLWYPHYQSPPDPSFNDFVPFGGWSSPMMKQYAGDKSVCGVGIDQNWAPKIQLYA